MRTKRSASARDDAIGTTMKAASVAAAIGGWAVGMYTGVILLWPLIATAAVWAAGKMLFGEARQAILPSFCVQAGHFAWFVIGMLLTGQYLSPALFDATWLAIGLVWLWMKPGKAALCFLGVYQLISLPYDALRFSEAAWGTAANKALLVHIIWHVLAVFYMAWLYYRMTKPPSENDSYV
ncbi:hypothetical protein [Dyella sp. 2HG41-7]|uniref:hypothetical protein n=1 Tax=Dyella sp. 2HG41-7 TaxID=2883239 RepID=UPI001F20D683|nr:hypothetical protein [Dyella sp. 2HG41-7]